MWIVMPVGQVVEDAKSAARTYIKAAVVTIAPSLGNAMNV